MVSRRPWTVSPPRWERMRLSSRAKKAERRKKLPSKVNENGIVGKPAGPTTAPGGSVAVAACAAAAGWPVEAVDPEAPLPPPEPFDPFEDPLDPLEADGAAEAPLAEFWSLIVRKST